MLASLIAIGLALAIALAGPGTRFGLWEYGTGLTIIRKAAMPVMIAAGVSAAAFLVALFAARGVAIVALIAAVFAGVAAMVPIKMKAAADANPFIHDITTDFDNPPPILAAADLDRKNPPRYVGDESAPRSDMTTAEAQRAAFPDIAPIETAMSVQEAAALATAIVQEMGMDVLSDGAVEDGWLIEAADTTLWFGFVDDFIVRIEPAEAGVVIDLRSKSRVGVSDLGANAARMREFTERFRERAA